MSDASHARRGRPAGSSPDRVLGAARRRFLRGERVDVQAIASELGIGRTTVYRWFGTREELVGEVLAGMAGELVGAARRAAGGNGATALLDTFDRFNRMIADAQPLQRLMQEEREFAMRVLIAPDGRVQPLVMRRLQELIEVEVADGYAPPVDPGTLAYAVVRLGEAFLYRDVTRLPAAGEDLDRLRAVEAALLGIDGG